MAEPRKPSRWWYAFSGAGFLLLLLQMQSFFQDVAAEQVEVGDVLRLLSPVLLIWLGFFAATRKPRP